MLSICNQSVNDHVTVLINVSFCVSALIILTVEGWNKSRTIARTGIALPSNHSHIKSILKKFYLLSGRTRPSCGSVRVRSAVRNNEAPPRRHWFHRSDPFEASTRIRRGPSPLLLALQQNHARSSKRTFKVRLANASNYLFVRLPSIRMLFHLLCRRRFYLSFVFT